MAFARSCLCYSKLSLRSTTLFEVIRKTFSSKVSKREAVAAEKIWNYMLLDHKLVKSDIILVFGNHDTRTAEYASQLYKDGLGKWLMFSGNRGFLTMDKWENTEAEVFKEIALSEGVPSEQIILEKEATNTGENVLFSHTTLSTMNLVTHLKKIILVQMPHMERRIYATFMKQWPGDLTSIEVSVSSPPIPLKQYPNRDIGDLAHVIAVLLGCLYRIKVYPGLGYQIPQDIPNDVWDSYQQLIETGKYSQYVES